MIKISLKAKISKGESVIAPNIECEYLTSNKAYVVNKVFIDGSFSIKDDNNKVLFCTLSGCGHLDGLDWIKN